MENQITGISACPEEITTYVGKWYYDICASISPDNVPHSGYYWCSENPSVVSVNPYLGYLHGEGVGRTRVFVISNDDPNIYDTICVTVKKFIPVESITVNATQLNLKVGESCQLTAQILPANASIKDLSWHSSDRNVATVDENGLVTMIGNGTATISVRSTDGSRIRCTCEVSCRNIVDGIIENIENCPSNVIPQNRKGAAIQTAATLIRAGYEVAFVAGMIANIVKEGSTGQFESSKYISHPELKPDYLTYMDTQYNGTNYYLNNYSGKTIMEVNVGEVYRMLYSLKTASNGTWKIDGSRVGFGLGSIQWTFERSYQLINCYMDFNNRSDSISESQAEEAEAVMILRELQSPSYSGIISSWRESCDDLYSANAANLAAILLCNRYLIPADTGQAQIRATLAESIYSVMTG